MTLINDEGMDVGNGICHSVSADLVVDSDGTPLGNDRVAIQSQNQFVKKMLLRSGCFL